MCCSCFHFHPEGWGILSLWNVGTHPSDSTGMRTSCLVKKLLEQLSNLRLKPLGMLGCYTVCWIKGWITWNFWRKSCTEELLGIRYCHVIVTFFYRNLASQWSHTIGVCQERGVVTYVQWQLLTSWMKPGCLSYRTFHCATYLFITQILEISKCFCFAAIL